MEIPKKVEGDERRKLAIQNSKRELDKAMGPSLIK